MPHTRSTLHSDISTCDLIYQDFPEYSTPNILRLAILCFKSIMSLYKHHSSIIASLIIPCVLVITFPRPSSGENIGAYRLKPLKDTVLMATGFSLQLAGNRIVSNVHSPESATLDSHDVPSFDRFASNYYSRRLSNISDYTKDAATGLMVLTALPLLNERSTDGMNAFITDFIMYMEAESLIIGLTKCAKGLSERSRPYAYNTDLSIDKREARNASLSFWSGHTSFAFTTAVFTGYVYGNRHPGSRYIAPVWISALSCATATGILRVRSGNHYPSDVVAGAAAGSLIGWLVPRMHHSADRSLSITTAVNRGNGVGIVYVF